MRIERDDFIIQGVPWRIVIDRSSSELCLEDAYGRTNFDTHTITLAVMPWEETIESLLHELMHVLTRGLESCDLAKSEDALRTFSIALVDTITRNGLTFDLEDKSGW